MGGKVVETAHNISRAFGVGTDNERTAQFRNGDESLEDEERRGRPLAIDDDQLKTIVEADSHKTTRVVAEEPDVDHSTVVRHLHRWEIKKAQQNSPRATTFVSSIGQSKRTNSSL